MPTLISGSTGVNKIQDGTITNADINSSAAIAGTKLVMPTGSVVQVVHYTSTVAVGTQTTADPTNSAGISLGTIHIIPKLAGSSFLVTATWSYNWSPTTNYQCNHIWLGRKIGTGNQSAPFTEIHKIFNDYEGANSGRNDPYARPVLVFADTPSYSLGQTISYEQRLGSGRGSGGSPFPTITVRNGGNMPPANMIIQEIAG